MPHFFWHRQHGSPFRNSSARRTHPTPGIAAMLRSIVFLLALSLGLALETKVDVPVSDTLSLPGYLTLPSGATPLLGVVLIHGAGTFDADLTMDLQFANGSVAHPMFFRDIANYLEKSGVAVLRYTKRSQWCLDNWETCQSKQMTISSLTDFENDAVGAVKFLQQKIDPQGQIALLAYDQGADFAPRVASRVVGVRNLILVGGMGTPVRKLVETQLSSMVAEETAQVDYYTAQGLTEEAEMATRSLEHVKGTLANCSKMFADIEVAGSSSQSCQAPEMQQEWLTWAQATTDKARYEALLSATRKQQKALRVLALNGASDWSVPTALVAPLHELLLRMQAAGQLAVETIVADLLDHNMMISDAHEGPSIAPQVLDFIEDFLCIDVALGDITNPTHRSLCTAPKTPLFDSGLEVAAFIMALLGILISISAVALTLVVCFRRPKATFTPLTAQDFSGPAE
ncbi:hypothetical protein PAPYR_6508 [Paratrimastix pyriformis]|uniref:Uncharacterized protein n=1 Tax=Paratrimastix pyriformis TaxID=342808 RepID=A0ABQ8UHC5_9EUKA|nr:hypothetical protein PAPYR_6508 [Paratrimastix pyriformis]